MKRLVLTVILSVAAVFAAHAQKSLVNDSDMKAFTAVNVSDDFVVTFVEADAYQLRTTIDERLDPFVAAYVKDGVLYITLDRKSFPAELKKTLRVRGAADPVLEAEVRAPFLNSLEVTDNVIVKRTDEINSDYFNLMASGKSNVLKLNVNCRNANLHLSGKSSVDANVKASAQAVLETSGTSKAVIRHSGDSLKTVASGSSFIEVTADTGTLEFDNSGMSDLVVVGGNADELIMKTSGSAKVSMTDVKVSKAYAVQSGSSKCVVNVADTLKVNLTGHSSLQFKNNPYIDLEKIVSSSLTRYEESASK
jgi:hypothetical protein